MAAIIEETRMSFVDGLAVETQDGVAVMTMSNPGRRNAFYPEMRERMRGQLVDYAVDPAVRVVILTGDGGHFCTGADLKRVAAKAGPEPTILSERERMRTFNTLLTAIAAGGKPVIAAVEGDAIGAGMSMAAACDVVVAARNARFGASFAKLGLFPDMGLIYTLPLRVGHARAKRLMMSAAMVSGEEAAAIGLADELAEPGQALAGARAVAATLVQAAPLSLATIKAVLSRGVASLDEAIQLEMDFVPLLAASQDHKAALAGFLEKKPVRFAGV
jgi:enoyl-CoA hydratase/carnithine racemase